MKKLLSEMPNESIPNRIGGGLNDYNSPFEFDLSENGAFYKPDVRRRHSQRLSQRGSIIMDAEFFEKLRSGKDSTSTTTKCTVTQSNNGSTSAAEEPIWRDLFSIKVIKIPEEKDDTPEDMKSVILLSSISNEEIPSWMRGFKKTKNMYKGCEGTTCVVM
jgi:hypothetical protein